jgi:hypothetical protein
MPMDALTREGARSKFPGEGDRGVKYGGYDVRSEHNTKDCIRRENPDACESLLSSVQRERAKIAKNDDFPQSIKEASPVSRRKILSVQPSMITKDRDPFMWVGAPLGEIDGVIVPSDQAYTDMILDNGSTLPQGTGWSDFVTVESFSDKFCHDRSAFRYVNSHTIKYNGEPIWKLETEHTCNTTGTRGQSSSCIYMKAKGILRVKITHKGRNNVGNGWNSRETREYQVADIIKESGEARGRALFSQ